MTVVTFGANQASELRLCRACKACMPASVLHIDSDAGSSAGSRADATTANSCSGSGATAPLLVTPSVEKLNAALACVEDAVSTVTDIAEAAVVDTAVVQVVVGVVRMLPGAVDIAGQVMAGLLALADRFPLASQCGGVLKDLFAMYQVSS